MGSDARRFNLIWFAIRIVLLYYLRYFFFSMEDRTGQTVGSGLCLDIWDGSQSWNHSGTVISSHKTNFQASDGLIVIGLIAPHFVECNWVLSFLSDREYVLRTEYQVKIQANIKPINWKQNHDKFELVIPAQNLHESGHQALNIKYSMESKLWSAPDRGRRTRDSLEDVRYCGGWDVASEVREDKVTNVGKLGMNWVND